MRVLPDDVLLLIGDFLKGHQDRYNLVFVCRRFHNLFLQLAYQAASLKSCQHLQSFICSNLQRPELARAVRVLHFDCWQDKPATGHVDIADEKRPLLTNWVRTISQSDEERAQWEQDLQHGVSEAWIALLLPLISNLRRLRLIYPKNNAYLDRTLYRAVNGERPTFRSLQEVSLSHLEDDADDTKGNFLPSQILSFFQLPLMRTLSADGVLESDSALEARGLPPSSPLTDSPSSISEITLNASNGSKGMEGLIASCSSLKTFKYQHSDSHLHAEGYQPSAFYHSLAGSKNTLETLWLDTCGHHLPFTIAGANETHDEWFGSLADFVALKDMRIRLPNLLDVRYQFEPSTSLSDILPRSLESLYIEGCKENTLLMLLNQVRMVLGQRTSRFPALRRVDIEGFFHDGEDYEGSGYDGSSSTTEKFIKPRVYELAKPVRNSCAEVGIDLFLRDRVCLETMKGSPV